MSRFDSSVSHFLHSLSSIRYLPPFALRALAALILAAFMIGSALQLRYWQNSVTLFEHALAVTTHNWLAHYNLGVALLQQKKNDQAAEQIDQTLKIKPYYPEAHYSMGMVLAQRGQINQAAEHFSLALQIKPDAPKAHNNLGTLLGSQGMLDEAIAHYRTAVQLDPDYAEAHYNLGNCLMRQGKFDQARAHFETALNLQPDPDTAKLLQQALGKLHARRNNSTP